MFRSRITVKADKSTAAKSMQTTLIGAAGLTENNLPTHTMYRAIRSICNEDNGRYRVSTYPPPPRVCFPIVGWVAARAFVVGTPPSNACARTEPLFLRSHSSYNPTYACLGCRRIFS